MMLAGGGGCCVGGASTVIASSPPPAPPSIAVFRTRNVVGEGLLHHPGSEWHASHCTANLSAVGMHHAVLQKRDDVHGHSLAGQLLPTSRSRPLPNRCLRPQSFQILRQVGYASDSGVRKKAKRLPSCCASCLHLVPYYVRSALCLGMAGAVYSRSIAKSGEGRGGEVRATLFYSEALRGTDHAHASDVALHFFKLVGLA